MKSTPKTSKPLKGLFSGAISSIGAFFSRIGSFFKGLFNRVLGRKTPLPVAVNAPAPQPISPNNGVSAPKPTVVSVVPKPPVVSVAPIAAPSVTNPNPVASVATSKTTSEVPQSASGPALKIEEAPIVRLPKTETPVQARKKTTPPIQGGPTLKGLIAEMVKTLLPLVSDEQRVRANKNYENPALKYKALIQIKKEFRLELKREFFLKLEESKNLILECEAIYEKYELVNEDKELKKANRRVKSIDVEFDQAETHTHGIYLNRLARLKQDIAYATGLLANLKSRSAEIEAQKELTIVTAREFSARRQALEKKECMKIHDFYSMSEDNSAENSCAKTIKRLPPILEPVPKMTEQPAPTRPGKK